MEFFLFPRGMLVMYKCDEADATIIANALQCDVLTCSKRLQHSPSIIGYYLKERTRHIASYLGDGQDSKLGFENIDKEAETVMDAHDNGKVIDTDLVPNLGIRIIARPHLELFMRRCSVPMIVGMPTVGREQYMDYYIKSCISGCFIGIKERESVFSPYPVLFIDLIPYLEDRAKTHHGYCGTLDITYTKNFIIFGSNPSTEFVRLESGHTIGLLNLEPLQSAALTLPAYCGLCNPAVKHRRRAAWIEIPYQNETDTIFLR